MSTAQEPDWRPNLRLLGGFQPTPRMEGISMFNRTARVTSWALPLVLLALLFLTGVVGTTATALGVLS